MGVRDASRCQQYRCRSKRFWSEVLWSARFVIVRTPQTSVSEDVWVLWGSKRTRRTRKWERKDLKPLIVHR